MKEATHLQVNAVKHYHQSANNLPSSPPYNILKSYYLTKCRTMTLSGPVSLPSRVIKSQTACPLCCVPYADGSTSYLIQPERKKNRFKRRLLKKNTTGGYFTRYQEIYMKNFARKNIADAHNTLVTTCGFCKHKNEQKLQKSGKQTAEEAEQPPVQKSRKKKKRKDRFSGLNKDVVLALTPQNKSYWNPNIETPQNLKKDKVVQKKNLFPKQNYNDAKVSKKDIKKKQTRLKEMLNESKQKKSPGVTLKQFLSNM